MRDFLIETKVSAWRQRCRWVFPVTCLTQGICLGRFTWWRWRDLWRHRRGNSRCFVFKHTMRWLVFVFLLSLFFRTYSNHLWLLQPLVTVACFASDIPEKTTRFPEKRSCRNRKFLGMRRIFCRNFLQTFPKNIYAKIFLHHNFCTCWQGWLIKIKQMIQSSNKNHDLNQATKTWFKSSHKNQKNHVIFELCVMCTTHLIRILTGFHMACTVLV